MKELTGSLEKYLLTIYDLINETDAVKVKDVADKMKIGGASTSEAVKTLAVRGYIEYKPYCNIKITEKGILTAEEKILRHRTIAKFLSEVLLINNEDIDACAEKMEFSMPDNVFERFIKYLSFMQKCSCKEPKWVKSFHKFLEQGKMQKKCLLCAENKANFDNSSCCGCSSEK